MKLNPSCKALSIRFIVSSFLIFSSLALFAQIPEGYYSEAEGKNNSDLKTALHEIIKVGKRLSYGSGAGKTWSGFEQSDRHPDGHVWDMYSLNKRFFPGNGGSVSGMNIEHSVAKSWWGGTTNNAYKDLYHLNPSDAAANSARSNYPLGTNSGSRFDNGSIKVGNNTFQTEYTGLCFEPLDEYKGDFARAYLYMFTCYQDLSWSSAQAVTMLNNTETYPMLKPWAKDLLVQWSRQDPVSKKEQIRADEIYKIQENRNPYIDYPELVEYLWGTLVGQPFTTNQSNPVITSPSQGTTIILPETHFTVPSQIKIKVSAKRLTDQLAITLSGENAKLFTSSSSSISIDDAEAGTFITIEYNPQKAETATATLTIDGGGIASPITITLSATSIDNFMALPATNITNKGFTANWTTSSTATDYQINLYKEVIDDQGGSTTLIETDFDQMPTGWTKEGYTEIKDGEIRMASSSNNGSITSSDIDLTRPSTLTFHAKRYGTDSSPIITISVDEEPVGSITTEVDYKQYSIEIPPATKESKVTLAAIKSKRVYITDLNISTSGELITYPLVEGYPKQTGLNYSYNITDLQPNQNYRYTITSMGTNSTTSNPITVNTFDPTDIEQPIKTNPRFVASNNTIYCFDLPHGAQIQITDITGRILLTKEACQTQELINLTFKGFAFIRIKESQSIRTFKLRVQ